MGVGERGDSAIGGLLHPLAQGVRAMQEVCRVGVQGRDGFFDGRAGFDLVGDLLHLGSDPSEFFLAPRIGLVEVDRGADKVLAHEGISLAAAGVCSGRVREQLGFEEVAKRGVCRRRPLCSAGEVGLDGGVELGVAAAGTREERPEIAVVGRVGAALADDCLDLPARRDHASVSV